MHLFIEFSACSVRCSRVCIWENGKKNKFHCRSQPTISVSVIKGIIFSPYFQSLFSMSWSWCYILKMLLNRISALRNVKSGKFPVGCSLGPVTLPTFYWVPSLVPGVLWPRAFLMLPAGSKLCAAILYISSSLSSTLLPKFIDSLFHSFSVSL